MNIVQVSRPSLSEQVQDALVSQPSFLDRAWSFIRSPFDALVSIPALSILAIPAFSSWWTSINLLFFYLTWSTLILSNSPLKVELLGTLATRVIFYILPSIGFLVFDIALPSLAINIKEQGEVALALSKEQDGKFGKLWKVVIISCGNVLGSVILQTGVEILFTDVFHIRSAIRITTSLPLPWSIIKGLSSGLLLREILTYAIHCYVLHEARFSASRHHAQWQHAVPAPYSMIAHYDHPLPYILHVFLPSYLPAVVFRFHLLTYLMYLALISLEETFAYSGYNVLPSGFVLGGIARRQERHLMGSESGNFGCWGLCDLAMRTNLGSDVLEDMRDEAQTNDVGEKAKGKTKTTRRKRSRK
ncbi:hypothetical protein MMC14_009627 [Varicellaria rhodocarpa]|nr:hypothetical protein [Varicellaria rhodocarpa]